MQKLVILFVNYNCGKDIADNISCINNSKNIDHYTIEIIVVDNGSRDDSIKHIYALNSENVKIISSKTNLGFGNACNLGMQGVECKYLLLLNPDIKIFDDSISSLISFADDHPEFGIYGGITVDESGKCDNMCAWKEPSVWGIFCWAAFLTRLFPNNSLFNPDKYVDTDWQYTNKVDAVSGCFFLIEGSLWKQLEGFDPRYFMYSEEIDLCRRARLLGRQPLVTNSAKIVHYGSKTSTTENKLNFLYKSKIIYFKSNSPLSKYLIIRIIYFFAFSMRALIYLIKQDWDFFSIWARIVKRQFSW